MKSLFAIALLGTALAVTGCSEPKPAVKPAAPAAPAATEEAKPAADAAAPAAPAAPADATK